MTPEQFRTFSTLLSEAVLLVSREGRILASNPAVSRLGLERDRLEGESLFDLVADPRETLQHFLRQCSRSRQPLPTALSLRGADDKPSHCRCDGLLAQHESEGGITTLLLKLTPREQSVREYRLVNQKIDELNREIERRISLEKALQERNEFLQVTLTSIGDGVIVADASGRVTLMNAIASQLTGWSTELAAGVPLEHVYKIVNEDTGQKIENPGLTALRENRIVGLSNHTLLVARDGSEHPIDDSAAPIHSRDHQVIGAVLVFRDVSDRRESERNLLASQARQRAIFETAHDSIITMNERGEVVDFNSAATRTFGYDRSDAVGHDLADLIVPPRLHEKFRTGLTRYLETGDGPVLDRRIELPALRADGSEFSVEATITHVPLDRSHLFTAYVRDITERKRHEQYRNARHDATQVLTTADSLQEAVSGVLEAICRNLNWDLGFFWQVDDQEDALITRKYYSNPETPATTFIAASRDMTFRRGEGLPGSVWASGGPFWVLDVTRRANFPRTASAAKDGLHSAFACPIVVGEQTLGVIEFYNKSIKEPDPDLLEMAETVAGHLGQFIERSLAEDQLQETVEQLTDFFQNATIGLHWVGPDGTILRANKAELELLGYRPDEYVGHSIRDFHVDEDVIDEILSRLQAGEDLRDFPARLRCKDGSIREVLLDSNVMWKDGNFVHTRCFTRDVTDRNRAEARVREQEQRTRSILESITDAFFALDRRWRFTYVNAQAERLLGRSSDELLGTVIWEAYPGLKGSEFEEAYRKAATQLRTLSVTSYYPDHDRWYEAHVYPAAEGISVYFRDVSERKHNEAILAAQTRALELLVDGAPLGDVLDALCEVIEGQGRQKLIATVLLVDEEGRLRSSAGRRAPDAYSKAVDGVPIGPTSGSCGTAAYLREQVIVSDIATDPLWEGYRGLAISHDLMACWSTPIFSSDGKVLGTFAVYAFEPSSPTPNQLSLIDVLSRTAGIAVERRRDEEALRLADKRKDEFLATLAHELRNPLAPIRTGLEVMKLSLDNPSLLEEIRQTMERQTQQLITLVDDLLDVSRITRGKFELRKSHVNLSDVIHSALEASQPLIAEARHTLSVDLPDAPVCLDADPHRLAQIVSNLLNNAAKYTPDGGAISLKVECDGDVAVIAVVDNGMGIPAERRDSIFEMFTQIENRNERPHAGLGIGLTLVKSLVEMHGGQISVESDGHNQGSTFRVHLPTVREPVHTEEAPEEPMPAGNPCRVLIVDDNLAASQMLGMVVAKFGHDVQRAADGQEAIDLAARFRPHVILMDIGMPRMNGYQAARHIRQQPWGKDMTLVALTGWGQDEDKRKSRDAGFDHHLTKPAEPSLLQQIFSNLGQESQAD